MAFQMDFTDQYGVDWPTSYWLPAVLHGQFYNGQGQLVFNGYPSFAQANQRVVGQKIYSLNGAPLAAIMSTPVSSLQGGTLHDALTDLGQNYALTVLDTPTGQNDANGNPIMVSFFANATTVS
jgi:hypothetical protein